jgi:hypothetical protein
VRSLPLKVAFTAVSKHEAELEVKIAVHLDVAPFSLVNCYRCFGAAFCLHLQGDFSYVIVETVEFNCAFKCLLSDSFQIFLLGSCIVFLGGMNVCC